MAETFRITNLFSLEGKTALITGGSSGLGLMMAKGLLQNGVRVIIASRQHERCEDALKNISVDGEAYACAADMTKAKDRKRLIFADAQNIKPSGRLQTVVKHCFRRGVRRFETKGN